MKSYHVTVITADNTLTYTAVFMVEDEALKYIDEMISKGNTASISMLS